MALDNYLELSLLMLLLLLLRDFISCPNYCLMITPVLRPLIITLTSSFFTPPIKYPEPYYYYFLTIIRSIAWQRLRLWQ